MQCGVGLCPEPKTMVGVYLQKKILPTKKQILNAIYSGYIHGFFIMVSIF